MWSPKRNKTGLGNQFYENMLLVRPVHLVFSFNKPEFRHRPNSQRVRRGRRSQMNLGNAGAYWNSDGWRVDVEYQPMGNAIQPKDLIEQIRPTFPKNTALCKKMVMAFKASI